MKKILLLSIIILLVPAAAVSAASRTRQRQYVPDEIIVKFRAEAARELEARQNQKDSAGKPKSPTLQSYDAAVLTGSFRGLSRRYKLKAARGLFRNFRKNRKRLQRLLKKDAALVTEKERRILKRLKRAGGKPNVPALDRIYKLKVQLQPGQSLEDVVSAYNNHPDVEYAELNYIFSADMVPNDPEYPSQWALPKISAPDAWDIRTDASEVIVAVIDTGIDYEHDDIDDNMWINQAEFNGTTGVDDDGNGYIDDIYGYDFVNKDSDPLDDHGHGTHCAGIIAAEGDNSLDVSGLCWHGRIMALKFLDWTGYGSDTDAIEALYYAVENGAEVISNSWGGPFASQALAEAIDYAHSRGVIVVAAAGNTGSTDPHYPAYYENVLSVAATDSDDKRAFFSTYGEWVDIAAPGTDILSLSAGGGTTNKSGTSMSCPYVAGTCGLMLSIYPQMDIERVRWLLMESAEPIYPGVCASGRLNVYQALQAIVSRKGDISFEQEVYNCSEQMKLYLLDSDLATNGTHEVTVQTDGGDFETVLLSEQSSGIFTGTIPTDPGQVRTEDGLVQVAHGQIITAVYYDANDGTGNSVTVTDTATADCESPLVVDVRVGFPGRQPRICFQTNEPTTAAVRCGTSCAGPYIVNAADPALTTSHTVKLAGVLPETEYFFVVEAVDEAGNITIDDNAAGCYTFTTTASDEDIYVPAGCATIQEAVENCWDGRAVRVADGIYSSQENRDIDFLGRPITVQSENGPDNCIIDCNGSEEGPHRGFIFQNAEDSNSVLTGFTIANGYAEPGGAVYCCSSSPKITNCKFIGNFASAIYNSDQSNPIVTDCTFTANAGGGTSEAAGGMANYFYSSPAVTGCVFTENYSYTDGGAIRNYLGSDPEITNCTFSRNWSTGRGGGIYNFRSDPAISNCSFTGNSSIYNGGAGVCCYYSNATIDSCIISNNTTGGGICCYDTSYPVISNCLISSNTSLYGGGICNSVASRPVIRNCTIVGNHAEIKGGGLYNYYSTATISNSILWNNTAGQGSQIAQQFISVTTINYSDVQHGASGIPPDSACYVIWGKGNIDTAPGFVEPGCWADVNDPNIVVEPNDPNAVWLDGDYHLLEGSECINAGDADYVPEPNETDLDGRARILLGRVDMGAYEFNHIPIADAGPNSTVYAGIDGTAEVALDGSGSYDDDGDELTYLWSWAIDDKIYYANDVSPTIELPVGEHIIELVVSDGADDSEPGYVTVTVIGPLRCYLAIYPRTINRYSHKRWRNVTARLRLPAGISREQIDTDIPLLLYPGSIEASRQLVFQCGRGGVERVNIIAIFNKVKLTEAVTENSTVDSAVVGRLKTGQYFYGRRRIKIIDRRWRRWTRYW